MTMDNSHLFAATDAVFNVELDRLIYVVRGLIAEGCGPQQAGADLCALLIHQDKSRDTLAVCLAQAIRRIIDLEDAASL